MLLAEKGRIQFSVSVVDWWDQAVLKSGAREAPLNFEVAKASRLVQLPHEDPADRFLAATAGVYGLTLLSADGKLQLGSGFKVLPND